MLSYKLTCYFCCCRCKTQELEQLINMFSLAVFPVSKWRLTHFVSLTVIVAII